LLFPQKRFICLFQRFRVFRVNTFKARTTTANEPPAPVNDLFGDAAE